MERENGTNVTITLQQNDLNTNRKWSFDAKKKELVKHKVESAETIIKDYFPSPPDGGFIAVGSAKHKDQTITENGKRLR